MTEMNLEQFMKTRLFAACNFILAALITEISLTVIFPDRPSSMSFSIINCLSWGIVGYIFSYVRRPLNKLFLYTVVGVYMVGNMNAVASYFQYGAHFLTNLQDANLIYSLFVGTLSVGLLAGERMFFLPTSVQNSNPLRPERWNTVFLTGSLLFPFVWFADEILTLGRVPILTGESIIESMYSLNYGRLYGYGVLLGVSALLMWAKVKTVHSMLLKILLLTCLTLTIFIMVFDGRRIFLLNFLGASAAYAVVTVSDRKIWKNILWIVVLIIGLYMVILYFRQGGAVLKRVDAANIFSQVGVEYRDYAYMYTHHAPGSLSGYNWLGSAVGGFGNQIALALLGFDKNALVFSGSAYQIALVLRSNLGIRIGLLPEAWLQYGILGALTMIPIGVLLVWSSRLVEISASEVGRVLACMMYGILLLSFVGQTSAVTGYLSLLLYLWLLWRFLELFRHPAVLSSWDKPC
jgi:hypothetical protein